MLRQPARQLDAAHPAHHGLLAVPHPSRRVSLYPPRLGHTLWACPRRAPETSGRKRRVHARSRPLPISGGIGQQSAALAAVGRLRLLCGKSPDEIGAADAPDDPAVAEPRYAPSAGGGQQPRDLIYLRFLANRDHRCCHDVAGLAFRGAQAREKIGVEHLPLCEQSQPPVSASLAIRLVAADKVTFADHADWYTGLAYNRYCADPVLAEDLRDLADRCVRTDQRHCRCHHVACFHSLATLASVEGSAKERQCWPSRLAVGQRSVPM